MAGLTNEHVKISSYDEVNSSAGTMAGIISQYEAAYNNIFGFLSKIQDDWKGFSANTTLTNAMTYKAEFDALKASLDNYPTTVQNTNNNIRQADETGARRAGQLGI